MKASVEEWHQAITLAINPETPGPVLDDIAIIQSNDLRAIIVDHPNVLPQTLELLANSKSKHLRARIARSPKTPRRTLEALAGDDKRMVRRGVLENPAAHDEAKTLAAIIGV